MRAPKVTELAALAVVAAALTACTERPPPTPPRSVPIDLAKPGAVEVTTECAKANGQALSFVVVRDGKLRDRAFGKGAFEARDLTLRLVGTNEATGLVKRWDLDAAAGLENVTWRAPDTTILLQAPEAGALCGAPGQKVKLALEVVKGTAFYGAAQAVWVVSSVAK